MINFTLNGQQVSVDVADDTPLLWVLRDTLGLTGTKYGCGISACGACTVHVNGEAQRSCTVSVGSVSGQRITTIKPTDEDIDKAMAGVICRCGTYVRIRAAIKRAAAEA